MQTHRRQRWFALGFGVFGGLFTTFGAGVALRAAPPPLLLAACGLLAGSAIGWLAASLPARARLPLGLGALSAAVGAIGVPVFLATVLGRDLLDTEEIDMLVGCIVASGVGWVLGAAIGAALAAHAEPLTAGQAWLLRGLALVSFPIALTPVWIQSTSAGPSDVVARSIASLRVSTLADAAIVCITLLLVAGGRHERSSNERRLNERPSSERSAATLGPKLASGTATTGLVLAGIVTIGLLRAALVTPSFLADDRRADANRRTADSLAGAARRYLDREGSYPTAVPALLSAGGRIQPGSVVTYLAAQEDRFCLTVGTETGTGAGGEPFWSAVVRPRSVSSGTGDTQAHSCEGG
jgi:hypothetical protein